MCKETAFSWKDSVYLITFFIGFITFIKTFRKKDFCELNYKTVFGDETNLYIFRIKGVLYNLKITCKNKKITAVKYKNIDISKIKKQRDQITGDQSLFFPIIEENEVIEIREASEMEQIRFDYEDKFSNKYYQIIKFDHKTDKDFNSRRFYKLSKRIPTPIWKRII